VAVSRAAAGDVVGDGVYCEALSIGKKVAIRAANRRKAVISGRYGPELFGDGSYTDANGAPTKAGKLPHPTSANIAKGKWLPTGAATNTYAPLVNVTGAGARLEGLVVGNSAGRGVQAMADDVTLFDCHVDFCSSSGVYIGGSSNSAKKANIRMEQCEVTRCSIRAFDPTRDGSTPMNVDSVVVVKFAKDPAIIGNAVVYNYGEGIWIGNGTTGAQVIGNFVHDNLHVGIYFNGGGTDAVCAGNVAFACENLRGMLEASGLNVFDLALLADEEENWQSSGEIILEGNLFVGGYAEAVFGIGAWNGSGKWPRPFSLNGAWISNCTFVGGPGNNRVIDFGSNAKKPHKASLWENCIFLARPGQNMATATTFGGGYGAVHFRNNLSNGELPAQQKGINSVVTDGPALKNPFVEIRGVFDVYSTERPDAYATDFDWDNYRPAAGSAALGMASDGSAVNGVTPAAVRNYVGALEMIDEVEPEPEPEPPPPDPEPEANWRDGLEQRERDLLESCAAYAAGPGGGFPGEGLILLADRLAGMLDGG
jgi:hypothetical protein